MNYQSNYISQPLMLHTHSGVVAARRATAADTLLLSELLGRLSPGTRHLRYMSSRHFSHEAIWSEAARMVRGNAPDYTTIVATIRHAEDDEAVAVAELARDQHDRSTGEIALLVRDDMQRQGIGLFLLQHLVYLAQQGGITRLSANLLVENLAMFRLIGALKLPYTATTSQGETHMLVAIPAQPEAITLARGAHKLAA